MTAHSRAFDHEGGELLDLAVIVMAKAPIPGRVKTRLCPPLTPEQAAILAAGALLDTMQAVSDFARTDQLDVCGILALSGPLTGAVQGPAIAGLLLRQTEWDRPWRRMPQIGRTLTDRLMNAHAKAHRHASAVLQIGMDTPQISAGLLAESAERLRDADVDVVLGLAADGGWWALGAKNPRAAKALDGIRTSTDTTGAETLHSLQHNGFRVACLPTLVDVDTIDDAELVADLVPQSRFAGCLRSFERAASR